MKFLVINGPNINFLGIREKNIYGSSSYPDMCSYIKEYFEKKNIVVEFFQSNIEGELIDRLQQAYFDKYDGIVINPGGYTHTSIALLDAIKSINIPTIEVHISNIHKREEFRHISYTAKGCLGQIAGFGKYGYILAIDGLINFIEEN